MNTCVTLLTTVVKRPSKILLLRLSLHQRRIRPLVPQKRLKGNRRFNSFKLINFPEWYEFSELSSNRCVCVIIHTQPLYQKLFHCRLGFIIHEAHYRKMVWYGIHCRLCGNLQFCSNDGSPIKWFALRPGSPQVPSCGRLNGSSNHCSSHDTRNCTRKC